MDLALEDRRAVVVRIDAALEQRVAIEQQVMGGDRGRGPVCGLADEVDRVARGDVFEDHAQAGKTLTQGQQIALDEDALAVEDVDRRVGDLAMQQQRNIVLLHRLDHRIDPGKLAHAILRIGRRTGRVVLDRKDAATGLGPRDLLDRRRFGQVQGHQRLEAPAAGQAVEDALPVGFGLGHGGHRRLQVRHHDRPGEAARAMADDRGQRRAVAQVQMPVVGTGDLEVIRAHAREAPLRPGPASKLAGIVGCIR